jgi:hypothetical protein
MRGFVVGGFVLGVCWRTFSKNLWCPKGAEDPFLPNQAATVAALIAGCTFKSSGQKQLFRFAPMLVLATRGARKRVVHTDFPKFLSKRNVDQAVKLNLFDLVVRFM